MMAYEHPSPGTLYVLLGALSTIVRLENRCRRHLAEQWAETIQWLHIPESLGHSTIRQYF